MWVYRKERPALDRIIDVHRALSQRMPLGIVLSLSRLMAFVGGLKRRLLQGRSWAVSRLAAALNMLPIRVSMHPDLE